jgi:hypothetical protein
MMLWQDAAARWGLSGIPLPKEGAGQRLLVDASAQAVEGRVPLEAIVWLQPGAADQCIPLTGDAGRQCLTRCLYKPQLLTEAQREPLLHRCADLAARIPVYQCVRSAAAAPEDTRLLLADALAWT